MAIYAIYKLIFEKAEQTCVTASDAGEITIDKAQDLLDEVLKEELPMSKTNKRKEQVRLENYLERTERGISLLMICNEKNIQYSEKKEDRTLTSHPGCYVLIDNRPGVAQVAIERDSSFDGRPDTVRDILEAALNRKMEEYGLVVKINQKWKEGDFWTAVHEQCEVHKDRIRKVEFDFPNPDKVGPVDVNESFKMKMDLLSAFTRMVNADSGRLILSSDKDRIIQFRQEQEDMAAMVSLCSQNAYNISVRFEQYGMYRNGTDYKAFSELREEVLTEFRTGQRVLGREHEADLSLVQWLDEIRNVTKDYGNDTKTRKARKKVS